MNKTNTNAMFKSWLKLLGSLRSVGAYYESGMIESITGELERGNGVDLASACCGLSLPELVDVLQEVEDHNQLNIQRNPHTSRVLWRLSNPDNDKNRDDRIEYDIEVQLYGGEPFYKVGFDREGKMQIQRFRDHTSNRWSYSVCSDLTPGILLQII